MTFSSCDMLANLEELGLKDVAMAMSDWDTLAFDTEGKPCDGILKGLRGESEVEIYKNWLYVRDPRMWCKGSLFSEPTIAEVRSGHVVLSDFDIEAIRGPQQSIFCLVSSHHYADGEEVRRRMAGIGCCGYRDAFDLVIQEEGVDTEEWAPSSLRILLDDDETTRTFLFRSLKDKNAPRMEIDRPDTPEYDTKWVGLEKETLDQFMIWLTDRDDYEEYEEWLTKVQASEALRFNQGDAFFTKFCDVKLLTYLEGSQLVTPVGKSEEPLLSQMTKAMGKGGE